MTRLMFGINLAAMGLTLLGAPQTGAWAQQNRPDAQTMNTARYAVLTFDTADFGQIYSGAWWVSFQPRLTNGISDELTTEMVKAGYDVIERSRLKDVLKEQNLGQSGVLDPSTAAQVGKVLGVQYLVMGTLTEWGLKTRTIGAGGILGGALGHVGVKQTEARAVINFRVVDTTTGRIVAADEATGTETNTGVAVAGGADGNFLGAAVNSDEWWGSQIGKATRKAVHGVLSDIIGRKPGEYVILQMVDPDSAVIELDETSKLHKGQTVEIVRVTSVVRNERGKVIFTRTEPVGAAVVDEIQMDGKQPTSALLHVTSRAPGAEVKAGCLVRAK